MSVQPICQPSTGYFKRYMSLRRLAAYRDDALRSTPDLHYLFFEVTTRCNEYCRHCGSNCGDGVPCDGLSGDRWRSIIDQVAEDFPKKPMLCITGGEPLLRKDLFDIMDYAKERGFSWGMTTNGSLITPEVAEKLASSGMSTVSVSLDGLRDDHDWFRQVPGCWDKAVEGIRNLVAQPGFSHVQVTTVVNKRNKGSLDELYAFVKTLGVRSWRVINIEPIGRALEQPELLLDDEDYRDLFRFIVEKRRLGELDVCYGCSHYLGVDLERETRDWHFICAAGVMTASIAANGDILSCLDLPRRLELVEGNIGTDRFSDVWRDKYTIYRSDWRKTGKCKHCSQYKFCAGDSFHSWDFDKMEPQLCMKGILF